MDDSYLKLLRTWKTCLFLDTRFQGVKEKNKEKSSELLNECKEAGANARVITAPETDPTNSSSSEADWMKKKTEKKRDRVKLRRKTQTKRTKKHNKVR
jgi:hypothetical protein